MQDSAPRLDRLAEAADARLYLHPLLGAGETRATFSRCEIAVRVAGTRETARTAMPSAVVAAWAGARSTALQAQARALLERIAMVPPPFAGLSLDRPRLMGIVNVTPDSFSDGGLAADPERAVERVLSLAAAGADMIDIGAESTRPGATPVAPDEEIARLDPVLRALQGRSVPILSVDTRRAATMRHVLAMGVGIINDVSALTRDEGSLELVARAGASVVLMHSRGEPATMNVAPHYEDVVLDVYDDLEARLAACLAAGIDRARILVDPGIAFGKSTAHSREILGSLALFHGLGCGILVGVSRKGLLGGTDGSLAPAERLPASLAANLWALTQGAAMFRVHDVAETALAFAVWRALSPPPSM